MPHKPLKSYGEMARLKGKAIRFSRDGGHMWAFAKISPLDPFDGESGCRIMVQLDLKGGLGITHIDEADFRHGILVVQIDKDELEQNTLTSH